MIYSEEKSSDLTVPLAILLASAGIPAAPFATSGGHRSTAGRVWFHRLNSRGSGR
ncbi:hypothetical protein IE4872_PD01991 (plasmid) [Rhizobium gallicum]|uniref:Uncharacterized protein n=1 Tax=Rhizobium gallicum TaxID=56730 RepID=A0A1L5NX73_9HYPH|nr:hypothetical protein [Rhizobium gallicum]APO72507.1 hypothetical protein IE4872_PD01991 [Rhizobium gallicum]